MDFEKRTIKKSARGPESRFECPKTAGAGGAPELLPLGGRDPDRAFTLLNMESHFSRGPAVSTAYISNRTVLSGGIPENGKWWDVGETVRFLKGFAVYILSKVIIKGPMGTLRT